MAKRKKQQLEYIEWYDHSSYTNSRWRKRREFAEQKEPMLCASVGWLVSENGQMVILAGNCGHPEFTQDDDTSFSGDMTIIKKCIRFRKKFTI